MAVEAQHLGLERLLAPAPRLHEVVLLGGLAAAREALGEAIVLLPAAGPLVDGHALEPATDGWVDLDCTQNTASV